MARIVPFALNNTSLSLDAHRQEFASGEVDSITVPLPCTFGLRAESTAIHLCGTWGRRSDSRKVTFRVAADVPAKIETSLVSPFFTALGLTVTQSTISEGNESRPLLLRQQIRESLLSNQNALFSRRGIRTGEAILCADHLDIPLPSSVYVKRGDVNEVRDPEYFIRLFRSLTTGDDSIVPMFPDARSSGVEESFIPTLVYELFRNTHDHARNLVGGARNRFSLRGVLVKLHTSAREEIVATSDKGINEYLVHIGTKLGLKSEAPLMLLEVSVFDSGPGLAQHRSNRNLDELSLKDERKWLEACFKPYSTGVPSDLNRGQGLERVQRRLSELKAVLHVRSGRLSLCRDFNVLPYQDHVSFFDALTLQTAPSQYPEVDGALFTVVIPCRELS